MEVFLSYARDNRPLAERICRLLETEGHQVFFDHDDLHGGDEFDAVIRREIEGCDVFLFLIATTSIDPGSYSLTELAIAVQAPETRRPAILPVRIDAVPFEALPATLRGVSVLVPEGDIPAEVAHAVARIAKRRDRRRLWIVGGGSAAAALTIALGLTLWWMRAPAVDRPDTVTPAATSGVDPVALNDAILRQTPPERFVTVFAVPAQNSWSVTLTIADRRVTDLRYRVDGRGEFVSTGSLGFVNPLTGLPIANPTIGLTGPFWSRRQIEVFYTDPDGREHGPYQVPFDPREHFVAFAKQSLQGADWVRVAREPDGSMSANFGTATFYRHGLRSLRYSVNDERLDRELNLAGGVNWFDIVPEHVRVPLPRETRFVSVRLTFLDGTASDTRRYDLSP